MGAVALGAFVLFGATGCPTQPSAGTGFPVNAITIAGVPSIGGHRLGPLALSDDGFTVVYSSQSESIDAPAWYSVHDTRTSTTTSLGNSGNYTGMGSADVSVDGRYVAFVSRDPSLRPGTTDPNCRHSQGFFGPLLDVPCTEIYLRDMSTGLTVPVTGEASSSTYENVAPELSADGRYVTYIVSTSIIPEGSGGPFGIRRWDRDTGTTEIVQDGGVDFWDSSRTSRDGLFRFDYDGRTRDLTATDLTTGVTDVLNNHDTHLLTDVTADGSAALVNCNEQYPRSWCLIDRVTRNRRNVPGHPDYATYINGDATKVLGIALGGPTNQTRLLLWTI